MIDALAWSTAIGGLVLGGLASVIPGFPGCAVALIGVVAFAGLTDFRVVGPGALGVAALITALGAVGQLAGPVSGNRALGGTSGSATGAALGAAFGALVPLPGASWTLAVLGAVLLGVLASRQGMVAAVRGVVGTVGGCAVGAAVDFAAVVGLAGVLAFADFLSVITPVVQVPG